MPFKMTSFFFVVVFALNAFSATIGVRTLKAKAVGEFKVGVGSAVQLTSDDPKMNGPALFLGQAISPNAETSFRLYLNEERQRIYYVDHQNFQSNPNLQRILHPYEQAGGTCSGYAIYHYMHQLRLSSMGNEKLEQKLSDEKNRTSLLVDNINEYYLTPQRRYSIIGILNKYGQNFGFSCKKFKPDSYEIMQKKLLDYLDAGVPVLVSFSVGTEMATSPFVLTHYQHAGAIDNRLWLPRKIGDRNSGGHAIVITGSFQYKEKTFVVILDSDWSEPRVWDLEAALGAGVALSETEFMACQ